MVCNFHCFFPLLIIFRVLSHTIAEQRELTFM
jgi:hypothetical protein